jgi:hypothetical protein
VNPTTKKVPVAQRANVCLPEGKSILILIPALSVPKAIGATLVNAADSNFQGQLEKSILREVVCSAE